MWIIPSLGRPARLADTLAAIRAAGCDSPGLVLVGPDDALPDAALLPAGWSAARRDRDRASMPAGLNHALAIHPDEPWYGYLGDDTLVRTPGWDAALIAAAGRRGMASCNDGWNAQQGRMSGILCFGGDLVRAWGFIHPPFLSHCFGDDFWEDIARRFGNWTVLEHVRVEHLSALDGTAAPDAAHRAAYAGFDLDRRAWEAWRGSLSYLRLVDRVAALFDGPRLSLDAARERSVMIGTPVYRDTSWRYTQSLVMTCEALTRLGIAHECRFIIGNSNLPKARNELCAEFLASRYTDLLMVDSDMGWQPEAVLRLLASPRRLIGGAGRRKTAQPNCDPHAWCVRLLPGDFVRDEYGALEVAGVGTGFLRINRGVFQKMTAQHWEWRRTGRPDMAPQVRLHYHQFFRFDPDRMDELSEDYVFCERWRNLGGRVWIDPEIRLSHAGEHDYGGCVGEALEAEPLPDDDFAEDVA